jgi:hypothetical protein
MPNSVCQYDPSTHSVGCTCRQGLTNNNGKCEGEEGK